jgi:hypothetical protein
MVVKRPSASGNLFVVICLESLKCLHCQKAGGHGMAETEQDKEIEKKWGVDPDTLYRSIGHFVFNFSRFEDVVRGQSDGGSRVE